MEEYMHIVLKNHEKNLLDEEYRFAHNGMRLPLKLDLEETRFLIKAVEEMRDEVKPKGKWIGIGYDGYANGNPVYDEWECSNCGHEIKTEDTPPYCEMCGAKMEINENEPLKPLYEKYVAHDVAITHELYEFQKAKVMTNKEVINSMSTEELAKYLFNRGNCQEYCYGICAFQDDSVNPYVKGEGFCIEQICKWLESENEEELR